ncbi:hypothetical protein OOT00_07710 [Desulfobotulus sp. H1]|uniref:CASTOR/POLLUX/SYM8 ion channel conserved domain-containing protein n=1 Tax=Desulfobotulus pelophilus TaxID=2823377 RepID=A0ABT3N8T2_9BACT|nr:hypothetical protein [Desulfobotulus pelophilus]MCW7753867.1 hypothetical protein [Desulfobotulus pelophilus]
MKAFSPMQRFRYFLERLFIRGTPWQFLVMATLIGLISILGGILVYGSGEPGTGIEDEIWWAFLRLTDPGYLGDDEGIWRRTVSTVLTVSGYVLFLGALVAILTQWLGRHMRSLERGLSPVNINHHIVILGWTDRTLPLLRELWLAEGRVRRFLSRSGGSGRLRLVVLAEDLRPELAQELRSDAILGKHFNSVILRSGSALNNEHLHRAACLNAAAVIVPARTFAYTGAVSSDVEVIKILLALNSQAATAGAALPYVVTEIQEPDKVHIARRAFHGPMEVVAGDSFISKIMIQTVRHPGLSHVCLELFHHGIGQNLYIHQNPDLDGSTIDRIREGFPKACLCGLVREKNGDFSAILSPPGHLILQPGDSLVMLAKDFDAAREYRQPCAPLHAKENTGQTPVSIPVHTGHKKAILIAGWSQKVPELLRELVSHGDMIQQVTIFSSRPVEERVCAILDAETGIANHFLHHITGEVTSEEAWCAMDLRLFDTIVLLSSDRLASGEEADARTIVGYLQLEALLETMENRPQILLELSDPNNRRLLGHRKGEAIISPLLLGHLLVHVALRREMLTVLHQLFRAGGPEITFRSPAEYGLTQAKLSFADLCRRAWEKGETLLGLSCSGAGENPTRSLCLNPAHNAIIELKKGDCLVVIAGQNPSLQK